MHADVHKGAERGDVGDDAGEFQAGLEVFHFLHAGGERKRLELLAWIAAGLGEFGEDVFQSGEADFGGGVVLEANLRALGAVAQ